MIWQEKIKVDILASGSFEKSKVRFQLGRVCCAPWWHWHHQDKSLRNEWHKAFHSAIKLLIDQFFIYIQKNLHFFVQLCNAHIFHKRKVSKVEVIMIFLLLLISTSVFSFGKTFFPFSFPLAHKTPITNICVSGPTSSPSNLSLFQHDVDCPGAAHLDPWVRPENILGFFANEGALTYFSPVPLPLTQEIIPMVCPYSLMVCIAEGRRCTGSIQG